MALDHGAGGTWPLHARHVSSDLGCSTASRPPTAQMKAAGKTFDPVVYEGAGHGFMRAGEAPDANDANKKARQDAWVRWKDLLGK